jgi:hypothetical protein
MLSVFAIIYICFLPFSIKYHTEISKGRKIINEIDKYFELNQKYPNEYDWDIIEKIYRNSFLKDEVDFNESIKPYYQNVGDEYVLVYTYGFDEPHLWYYSKSKKWEYGNNIPLE